MELLRGPGTRLIFVSLGYSSRFFCSFALCVSPANRPTTQGTGTADFYLVREGKREEDERRRRRRRKRREEEEKEKRERSRRAGEEEKEKEKELGRTEGEEEKEGRGRRNGMQ